MGCSFTMAAKINKIQVKDPLEAQNLCIPYLLNWLLSTKTRSPECRSVLNYVYFPWCKWCVAVAVLVPLSLMQLSNFIAELYFILPCNLFLTTRIRSLSAPNNYYQILKLKLTPLPVQNWVHILVTLCCHILIFSNRNNLIPGSGLPESRSQKL